MPGLGSGAEPVAEHEAQRGLQHRLVGLLKASLLIEGEDLVGGSKFFVGALQETLNLRPIYLLRSELLHAALTSEIRLLCQTLSRKASFRFLRDSSSLRVRTV